MNFIHRLKRWRSTTTSTRTTTTAMSTTTTCSNCLLLPALDWGVGRGTFLTLLQKFANFSIQMVPKRCWPERSLCTDTAEVSDTFHMCGGIMYLLVCGVHGWIWCSKITKRVPRHVTHMHRYMAVPRTPVQTDRLDTTEASAVYRATRDRQVIKAATSQMSYFMF